MPTLWIYLSLLGLAGRRCLDSKTSLPTMFLHRRPCGNSREAQQPTVGDRIRQAHLGSSRAMAGQTGQRMRPQQCLKAHLAPRRTIHSRRGTLPPAAHFLRGNARFQRFQRIRAILLFLLNSHLWHLGKRHPDRCNPLGAVLSLPQAHMTLDRNPSLEPSRRIPEPVPLP